MNKFLLDGLRFLGLLDRFNKLSLTNLAVWICVVKIALSPDASLVELGALMIALANYAHKRHENAKAESSVVVPAGVVPVDLSPLQSQLDALKADHESIQKMAEETKKLLSNSNLAAAFVPRSKRDQ